MTGRFKGMQPTGLVLGRDARLSCRATEHLRSPISNHRRPEDELTTTAALQALRSRDPVCGWVQLRLLQFIVVLSVHEQPWASVATVERRLCVGLVG